MATDTESKTATEAPTSGATPGTAPTRTPDPKVDATHIPAIVANEKERAALVRGGNPATGAAAYLVENVIEDESVSAVALALRAAPVGTFHKLSADLRSVEASVSAAVLLVETFRAAGICMDVMTEDEFKAEQEEVARKERVAA